MPKVRNATIKAGTGVNVGYDFTRLLADTPMEVTEVRGQLIFGTIAGTPDHPRGFMRSARVHVQTDKRFVEFAP